MSDKLRECALGQETSLENNCFAQKESILRSLSSGIAEEGLNHPHPSPPSLFHPLSFYRVRAGNDELVGEAKSR